MVTEVEGDKGQPSTSPAAATGFTESVMERYRKIKEHAVTYPCVWGSYTVVYGGFGLWLAYRGWKLRKAEDRVRGLHLRLRKAHEAEEKAKATASAQKTPSPSTVKEILKLTAEQNRLEQGLMQFPSSTPCRISFNLR